MKYLAGKIYRRCRSIWVKAKSEKCEGLWIGVDKHRQHNCKLFYIKWPKDPIKCLRIYIRHNLEQCTVLNWHRKIEIMERILSTWKQRGLTILGKVAVN